MAENLRLAGDTRKTSPALDVLKQPPASVLKTNWGSACQELQEDRALRISRIGSRFCKRLYSKSSADK